MRWRNLVKKTVRLPQSVSARRDVSAIWNSLKHMDLRRSRKRLGASSGLWQSLDQMGLPIATQKCKLHKADRVRMQPQVFAINRRPSPTSARRSHFGKAVICSCFLYFLCALWESIALCAASDGAIPQIVRG